MEYIYNFIYVSHSHRFIIYHTYKFIIFFSVSQIHTQNSALFNIHLLYYIHLSPQWGPKADFIIYFFSVLSLQKSLWERITVQSHLALLFDKIWTLISQILMWVYPPSPVTTLQRLRTLGLSQFLESYAWGLLNLTSFGN